MNELGILSISIIETCLIFWVAGRVEKIKIYFRNQKQQSQTQTQTQTQE